MIILDSSVVIEHLRGSQHATRFLSREAARGELVVPALAGWELWRGATTPARLEKVDAFLAGTTVEPFSPAMARLAADLHRRAREAGREPPAFDLLIASHALFHGVPLATLDRDFEDIDGVDVVRVPRR